MDGNPDLRYQARGVSSGKAEVHEAVAVLDRGLYPGAFCKLVADDLTDDDEACLVMHADDVGTKTALAYLAWREGFGEEVWAGIAQDSLVMNLDDCACVGALGPFLISNTISRNARLIPGSVVKEIIAGYQVLCEKLSAMGVTCRMTGGETSDCGDVVRTIFVDSVAVARLRRDRVIDASRIQPGDRIISFSSTGQAAWEERPNSGIGSNGLTSARHDLLAHRYAEEYPETLAPELDRALIYCGPYHLEDPLPGDGRFSVGSALLSPTRTYLPLLVQLIESLPVGVLHGLIHCTGGGQTKIRRFGVGRGGRGLRYVKDRLPAVPPLFRVLVDTCGTSWREAYAVWNMGARLEAVVDEAGVDACLAVARTCAVDAAASGHVELADGPDNEVVIHTEGGVERYP